MNPTIDPINLSLAHATWALVCVTGAVVLTGIGGLIFTGIQLGIERRSRAASAKAYEDEAAARKLEATARIHESDARKIEAELRHSEFKAELCFRYSAQFDNPHFSHLRRSVAGERLARAGQGKPLELPEKAWHLLDFFESVAWACKRNRIELEDIANEFTEHVFAFHTDFIVAIQHEQKERKDESIYKHFLWLYSEISTLQKSHGLPHVDFTPAELTEYYKTELAVADK
jgi:hypothetical protein